MADTFLKSLVKSIKTKGARDRWVPIITRDQQELERLVEEFRLAGKKRVFQVPSALNLINIVLNTQNVFIFLSHEILKTSRIKGKKFI